MTHDPAVAALLTTRLDVQRAIDISAELSFMESARFRLELFDIVKRHDDKALSVDEAAVALERLRARVDAVISAAR